jgi:hypothetical protein
MYSDQAVSPEERRDGSEQLQRRLSCLVQGRQSLPESAAAPEIASCYKLLAYCIRSGGFAADRCVSLNCGIWLEENICYDTKSYSL